MRGFKVGAYAILISIMSLVIVSCGSLLTNLSSTTEIQGDAEGTITILHIERLFDRSDVCPTDQSCPDDLKPEVLLSSDANGRFHQSVAAELNGIGTAKAVFEVIADYGEIVSVRFCVGAWPFGEECPYEREWVSSAPTEWIDPDEGSGEGSGE